MAISSVSSNRTSRYIQGGRTEVGPIGLEWWDAYTFPTDPSDELYVVEAKYNHRIDLIANAFYNDWSLWWLLASFNNILDAYTEVVTGAILYIPTLSRAQSFMTQPPGGYLSTRQSENLLPPIVL